MLLYIFDHGPCSKMDLYNNISKNPNMPLKMRLLSDNGMIIITAESNMRSSVIRHYHRLIFTDSVDESELSFFQECFDMISPRIRKGPNGRIEGAGLKKYP